MKKYIFRNLNVKLNLIFVLFSLIIMSVDSYTVYNDYKQTILEEYNEKVFSMASAVAVEIDPELMKHYIETGEVDDKYQEVLDDLDKTLTALNVKYLYVWIINDDNQGVYIYDANNLNKENEERCELGDIIEEGISDFIKSSKTSVDKNTMPDQLLYTNLPNYGYVAYGNAVILDSEDNIVGYVGIDVSMKKIMARIDNFLKIFVLTSFCVQIFCNVVLTFIARKLITNPIKKVAKTSEVFVQNYDKEGSQLERVEVKNHDEIGNLAESINKMMSNIKNYVLELTRTLNENKKMSQELDAAAEIQKSLLPKRFPESEKLDIHGELLQSEVKMEGDFFDCFAIDSDHVGFTLGEVASSGVPAAIFMVMAKILIKNYAELGKSAEEIFNLVNKQLYDANDMDTHIEAFLGILEISTGALNCINAGHPNPFICKKNGNFHELKVKKHFVLAGMRETEYKQETFCLGSGDIILITTTGLINDILNKENKSYTPENLKKFLKSIPKEERTAKNLTKKILEEIKAFSKGVKREFDATIVTFKYNGKL